MSEDMSLDEIRRAYRRRLRETKREPEYSQMRARTQMRRLVTLNGKATGLYETTVGAVAKALRMTPEDTIELLRGQYLLILEEDQTRPMAEWLLFEDGE